MQVVILGGVIDRKIITAVVCRLDPAAAGCCELPCAMLKVVCPTAAADDVAAAHGRLCGVAIVVGAIDIVVAVARYGSGVVVHDQVYIAVYLEADQVLLADGDGVGGSPSSC